MTRPLIQIDDEIREMNDKELTDYEKIQTIETQKEADKLKKATAKDSALTKLAALGLTEDEINGIIS